MKPALLATLVACLALVASTRLAAQSIETIGGCLVINVREGNGPVPTLDICANIPQTTIGGRPFQELYGWAALSVPEH